MILVTGDVVLDHNIYTGSRTLTFIRPVISVGSGSGACHWTGRFRRTAH